LLVGLLELFQITDIDTGLVRKAMDQLLAEKSHAALIKLCQTFTEVDWPLEAIVKKIVQTKDWTSAELLVRTFEAAGDTGRRNAASIQEDSPLVDSVVKNYDAALAKVLIDETINLRDFKRVRTSREGDATACSSHEAALWCVGPSVCIKLRPPEAIPGHWYVRHSSLLPATLLRTHTRSVL
jgi:hypothetical protein